MDSRLRLVSYSMMLTTILLIFSCPWKGRKRELLCRVDMTDASKTIGFVADKLSDAEIASPSLKRASFGAAYANNGGKFRHHQHHLVEFFGKSNQTWTHQLRSSQSSRNYGYLVRQNSQLTHCTGSYRDLLNHIWL